MEAFFYGLATVRTNLFFAILLNILCVIFSLGMLGTRIAGAFGFGFIDYLKGIREFSFHEMAFSAVIGMFLLSYVVKFMVFYIIPEEYNGYLTIISYAVSYIVALIVSLLGFIAPILILVGFCVVFVGCFIYIKFSNKDAFIDLGLIAPFFFPVRWDTSAYTSTSNNRPRIEGGKLLEEGSFTFKGVSCSYSVSTTIYNDGKVDVGIGYDYDGYKRLSGLDYTLFQSDLKDYVRSKLRHKYKIDSISCGW